MTNACLDADQDQKVNNYCIKDNVDVFLPVFSLHFSVHYHCGPNQDPLLFVVATKVEIPIETSRNQ